MPARKKPKALKKVLVASRGEIAVRVIRACHELGIPTVAVFSDVDRTSLHVQKAAEAVRIGPASPAESYLNVDAIIAAAKATGADAIHPCYGFLAESPEFATRVEEEGLTFIGPPADVIRKMGSKIESRAVMREAGVPVVPGSETGSDDPAKALKVAKSIEPPLFVKASAGGGGKGMRLVAPGDDIEAAVRGAIGEAKAAFGDGTVYVEKVIEKPRHIEFQLLADTHGNIVHLYERECSIQRRHQKVLEEAPSPALTPELRAAMGEATLLAARAVGYVSAGTIEYLLEPDGNFYFLEMNTRIQVEHPVTEAVTGVDLVQWQLRIAAGEKIDFQQEDVFQRGHAIECRVYAEDETQNFMPSCGVISFLFEPSGLGVRNDSGVYEGWEVSPYYDPILSKLITYGASREMARRRMIRALREYVIHGVQTSIEMHQRILTHPEFIAANIATDFIDTHGEELLSASDEAVSDQAYIAAFLAGELGLKRPTASTGGQPPAKQTSTWDHVGKWEIGGKG